MNMEGYRLKIYKPSGALLREEIHGQIRSALLTGYRYRGGFLLYREGTNSSCYVGNHIDWVQHSFTELLEAATNKL